MNEKKSIEKAVLGLLRKNPEKTYTFREIAKGIEMGIFETREATIELVEQNRMNQEFRDEKYLYSLPESEKSKLDTEEAEESEDSEEEEFEAKEHTFIEEDGSTTPF